MTFSRFLALCFRHLVGPGLVLWSLAACAFLTPNTQSSLQTPRPATADPIQTRPSSPAPFPSSSDRATPPVVGLTATPGPLRPHQSVALGSGIFAHATYSVGQAPITDDELLERFPRTNAFLDPTGRGDAGYRHMRSTKCGSGLGQPARTGFISDRSPQKCLRAPPPGYSTGRPDSTAIFLMCALPRANGSVSWGKELAA